MIDGCTATLTTMSTACDGPFRVEVVGCVRCDEAYVVIIEQDARGYQYPTPFDSRLTATEAQAWAIREHVRRQQ